jgi:hypothetical protein
MPFLLAGDFAPNYGDAWRESTKKAAGLPFCRRGRLGRMALLSHSSARRRLAMNRITTPLPGTVEDPRYPDQDGRFMGDTDFHNVAMTDLKQALQDHFADEPV